KPTREERDRCLPYLVRELRALSEVRCIVCLGGFAWEGALAVLAEMGHSLRPRPRFGHGTETQVGPYTVLGGYHVSQQNAVAGRLPEERLDAVFRRAREVAGDTGTG